MPKGHGGQTCSEAVRASIRRDEVVSFSELRKRVKALGSWKNETIVQHLMSLVVNLPPARALEEDSPVSPLAAGRSIRGLR
jgi:hypothetical protein